MENRAIFLGSAAMFSMSRTTSRWRRATFRRPSEARYVKWRFAKRMNAMRRRSRKYRPSRSSPPSAPLICPVVRDTSVADGFSSRENYVMPWEILKYNFLLLGSSSVNFIIITNKYWKGEIERSNQTTNCWGAFCGRIISCCDILHDPQMDAIYTRSSFLK